MMTKFETPFWRWFGNSVVRNPDGTPMVVYHGTIAKDPFTAFRVRPGYLGIHFGTRKAAAYFVGDRLPAEEGQFPSDPYRPQQFHEDRPRIYPVYLSIQRAYAMGDVGGWESDSLFTLGGIDAFVDDRIITRSDVKLMRKMDDETMMQFLRNALTRAGYDGITYDNETEDPGSTSYLIWNLGQVKSAIGNRGTFDINDPNILHGLRGHHRLW